MDAEQQNRGIQDAQRSSTPDAQTPLYSTAASPVPAKRPEQKTIPANKVPPRKSQKSQKSRSGLFGPTAASGDDDISQVLLTWLIQVTGLAAAIIFGVFSILSWVDSQHAKAQAQAASQQANDQARQINALSSTSNLLAIAAICAQSQNNGGDQNAKIQAICDPFFQWAWPSLAVVVESLVPYTPTLPAPTGVSSTAIPGPSYSAPPDSGNAGAADGAGAHLLSSPGQKVALGVGLGVGLMTLAVSLLTWSRFRRRRNAAYVLQE